MTILLAVSYFTVSPCHKTNILSMYIIIILQTVILDRLQTVVVLAPVWRHHYLVFTDRLCNDVRDAVLRAPSDELSIIGLTDLFRLAQRTQPASHTAGRRTRLTEKVDSELTRGQWFMMWRHRACAEWIVRRSSAVRHEWHDDVGRNIASVTQDTYRAGCMNAIWSLTRLKQELKNAVQTAAYSA